MLRFAHILEYFRESAAVEAVKNSGFELLSRPVLEHNEVTSVCFLS